MADILDKPLDSNERRMLEKSGQYRPDVLSAREYQKVKEGLQRGERYDRDTIQRYGSTDYLRGQRLRTLGREASVPNGGIQSSVQLLQSLPEDQRRTAESFRKRTFSASNRAARPETMTGLSTAGIQQVKEENRFYYNNPRQETGL
jgi:hypothetical protein